MNESRTYWRHAVPLPDSPSRDQMVAHYAAMANAHFAAYQDAIVGGVNQETVNAAVFEHFDPAVAAFTAAAALEGWTPDRIMDAVCDGGTAMEFLWQWVDDKTTHPAGTDALLASLTTHIPAEVTA